MMLFPIAILSTVVISACVVAQQPQAQLQPLAQPPTPPPQQPAPPFNIPSLQSQSNQLLAHQQEATQHVPTPQQMINPPTKPPLVQLTRTSALLTTARPQQEFASTSSLIPSTSIITIDVSQTPSTSAPQATQPTSKQPVAIQESTLDVNHFGETHITTPAPSSTLGPTNFSQPQESLIANASSPLSATLKFISSEDSNSTVNEPVIAPIPITTTTTTTSTPFELATPAMPAPQPMTNHTQPTPVTPTLPTPAPNARLAESRRLPDNSPFSTSSPPQTPSTAVQFLKPKSKFKCQQETDCLNGGKCFSGHCFCLPGFTGESCAINIDECRQAEEPCLNNGVCVDEVNQFRCECQAGFKGDRCQETVDMCVGSPCFNGAKCVNHRTDYTCECEPGWEGKHCEKNIDECLKNPCHNNGTCHDLVNDYRCDCGSSGFTGKNCEIDFDDCAAEPCGIAAKECIDLTADFKCICHDGFTGKRCEHDIDECLASPCENNGTCIQKSSTIHHMHNLTTDLTIYHEIREQNLSSASVNMSQYAGYTCECKEEYYGDRCEERKKCYTKSVVELCNHPQAECVNVGSSYECLINASFDGSGRNYATYRVNGEFKMREIYVKYRSLTGGIIMSFETNQPDSPIADLQLNKSGLYLSGAPIKRDENIKFDELLDGNEREIRLGLDTPTEIKSITLTRQNIITDYHSPFKGCLMQVRLNNQLVPLVDYGFGMNHSFEFTENHLEAGQCRTCFKGDCLNNGQCEFQEGYDHCTCPDTFAGNFCEIDVNECEKNFVLCSNGGTCENTHGGYRCNCKEGFRGEKCQDISDYCKAKQPCVTGTCKNVNPPQGTYQCECPSSHIGKRCDRKRDCSNECHNHHAQCINNMTCACLPGRREERIMCEYVASCEQVEGDLCLNGGTCKNLESGGYQCACNEPHYGPICQFKLEKPQFDVILIIGITIAGLIMAGVVVLSFVVFRSVRKARATRGTYSPSTQEKFGNSASDLLKPPQPELLI